MLREREFGVVDGLTKHGIVAQFPKEAEHRARIGKFYYRPPGGESWCDVILRLRNVVDTLTRDYADDRVLIVAHEVVVMGFRYILEEMTEESILAIDRRGDVANCAITSYVRDATRAGPGVSLCLFNQVAPLVEAGEEVTRAPDAPVAPK
jgi:broad specificity phosphatase PhoE